MSLRIALFGKNVRVTVDREPVDLGENAYVLGLLTNWDETEQSNPFRESLSTEEIYRLIQSRFTKRKAGPDRQSTNTNSGPVRTAMRRQPPKPTSKATVVTDSQQSAIRHIKGVLRARLVERMQLPEHTRLEEILKQATTDVVEFRELLSPQLRRREPNCSEVAKALLLYDVLFLDGLADDTNVEDKILAARRAYEALFSQGVKLLFELKSPLLYDVVSAKRELIHNAVQLTESAPGILRGYRDAIRRSAADIPISVPQITVERTLQDERGRLTNLPRLRNRLIGREEEIALVKRHLQENDLVTLMGMGGAGKTTIMLQVGKDLLTASSSQQCDYKDGVWFVDLIPVAAGSDSATISRHILTAMGRKTLPNAPVQSLLLDHLYDKHILLLLDTCEHLDNAIIHLLTEIGARCPFVRILTTTRVAQGRAWGRQVRIHPFLPLDPASQPDLTCARQNEAIRLFEYYRERFMEHFTVNEDNFEQVLQICHLLSGIPLAIELVACQDGLLKDISASIKDHWQSIPQDPYGAHDRHQTMVHCLLWSYNHLLPEEQSLFRRLALFTGGWTLPMCRQVCTIRGLAPEGMFERLSRLCASSLVLLDATTERYRFLEPVRAFAEQQLERHGEKEEILESYESWLVDLIRMEDLTAIGSVDRRHVVEVLQEVPNTEILIRERRRRGELRAFELEIHSAVFRYAESTFRVLRRRFAPYVHLIPTTSRTNQLHFYLTMAVLDFMASEFDNAEHNATTGIEIARELSDRKHEAMAHFCIGLCQIFLNKPDGLQSLRTGFTMAEDTQDRWAIALGEMCMGAWHWHNDRHHLALPYYLASLDRFRDCGDKIMGALVLNAVAHLVRIAGEPVRAAGYYLESYNLSIDGRFKNGRGIAGCIMGTCGLAVTLQHDDLATLFWGCAVKHYDRLGAKLIPPIQADYDHDMLVVQNRLGSRFEPLRREGERLSLNEGARRSRRYLEEIIADSRDPEPQNQQY